MELLDVAFGPVAGARGRRFASDRVSLNYMAPLNLRLSMVRSGFVPGYVWDEGGKIVGNVSLIESSLKGRYLIANVAVSPEYRRQGVATGLLLESIDHIVSQGGREILLQVEWDNQGAVQLYESLGFRRLGTMRRWESTTSRIRPLAELTSGEFRIRPLQRGEWRAAYEVDRISLKPDLNWPTPPSPVQYQSGFWRSVHNLFNGRKAEIRVAVSADSGTRRQRVVGLSSVRSEIGQPHSVALRVAPGWHGLLEQNLLAVAIHVAKHLRSGTVRLNHPVEDDVATELLKEANFRARRTLTIMKLSLSSIPRPV